MDKLTLRDIKSPTIPGIHYFDKISDLKYKTEYQNRFNEYKPKMDVLQHIKEWLNKKEETLTILAIGAEWCPDCRRNISALLKIALESNDSRFNVNILSGVKTNPLRRTGADIVWAVPPSPPEVADPKFEVKAIPMIYFFLKNGECIGKITENPSHTKTVEEEILFYLKQVN